MINLSWTSRGKQHHGDGPNGRMMLVRMWTPSRPNKKRIPEENRGYGRSQ